MEPVTSTRLLFAIVLCLLLLSRHDSQAGIPMMRDYMSLGDTARIVIVKPDKPDVFRIEEVVLDEDKGDAKVGGIITLPGFKLFTQQSHGPDKVEAITPDTRILLYLKRQSANSDKWVITQSGYAFFWVQDAAKVGELRQMAGDAIAARRDWERARSLPDEKQRIAALWPFLESYMRRFNAATQDELQKVGTPAGDYLAERLGEMSPNQRMGFLPDLNLYQSERLHVFVIQHLKNLQMSYEDFLKKRRAGDAVPIDDWNNLPEQIKAIWGELYYGLDGLGKFQDRNDLPFIRELAMWAVQHRFKQTCDAALTAFRMMPDKANLPVIAAIWNEYSVRPYKGNEMIALDITRALRPHKYPETVPLLVPFLSHKNKDFAAEAQAFLTEIVGQDLGPEPDKWLQWYKTQLRSGA